MSTGSPDQKPLPISIDDGEITRKTLNDPAVRRAWDRDWIALWQDFCSDPCVLAWCNKRINPNEPSYCLPPEFIFALRTSFYEPATTAGIEAGRRKRVVSKPALLTPEEARTESRFQEVCQKWDTSCVGVWNKTPICHELLGPATSFDTLSDRLLSSLKFLKGSPQDKRKKLQSLDPAAARTHQTLCHRAGQLFSMTPFVRDLARLKKSWSKLSNDVPFPLSRCLRVTNQGVAHDMDNIQGFFIEVRTFLNRWQLLNVVTWELVTPLGPLVDVPLNIKLNGLGDVTISQIYPSYWPETQQGGVTARLQTPAADSLVPIIERVGENTIHQRAYEMRLAEIAYCARYAPAPRGYVTRLIAAFANRFGVKASRMIQIRASYLQNLPLAPQLSSTSLV